MRGLQSEGGYLRLSNHQIQSLITNEDIHKYFNVEDEPFARGKYAAVRRCRELSTGLEYAAKTLKKKPRSRDCGRAEILHEVAVLEACSPCRQIVSLHRVFESDQEITLVLELARGGELQTVLDSDDDLPSEKYVQELMGQILEAIAYLHNINVAHLDIKPQNLILMGEFPGCEVKLCDFGISRYLSEGADVREILGTPDYVAPEVLNYEPISLATDMWSVGVLLYVLLSGCSPFGGDTKQETFCNISQCRLDFPEDLFAEISEEAKDLITKLVVKSPSGRLTAEQCKNHPWFSKTFTEPSNSHIQVPSITSNKPRTPVPLKRTIVPEENAKSQVIRNPPPLPDVDIKTVEKENSINNSDNLNNNKIKNGRGLTEERRKSFQSNLASLMERLEVEEPRGKKVERSESLKRAAGMQTMPALRLEEVYKCQRVMVVEEDEGLPPSLASSSAESSSVSDSGSDRSSIISLDESLDYHCGGRLRHSSSCLNIWDLRKPNQSFTQALSKFRESERVKLRSAEERSKFQLFNSNRLSLPPPPPTGRKSIGLEFVREHNGNLVVIREVKAVQGKKYSRTSELKCETVQSRIRKLQQIKSDQLQNNIF